MIKANKLNDLKGNRIYSLKGLCMALLDACNSYEQNHIDPGKVPVVISQDSTHSTYTVDSVESGFGYKSIVKLTTYDGCEIDFNPEDKHPEGGGEFWQSRGPSSFDVSGFVVSKQAGERIMRYVRAILEKDETETYLDWRKFEPNWIQLKFSAKEFDCVLLDKLCRNNNDIITYKIMKRCKLANPSDHTN